MNALVRQERPGRVLPHNLDVEASILGGVILQNDVLSSLGDLETDDFYDLKHKVVWAAIRNLAHAERPIDVVTLEDEIERQGKLDAVGGVAFLGELTLRVPVPENVSAYRDTVRLHARNRRAILELSSALERAYTWPHDPAELISEAAGRLQRLEQIGSPPSRRLKLLSVGQALEDMAFLKKAPIYPTPFPSLNDAIGFGGFLGTQVYTVCAGTGRGKTTWVAAVAAHAAQTVPVIVASYEMQPGYFVARKAAGVLGFHSNDILRGEVPMAQVLAAMPYPSMYLMHKPTLRELREAVEHVKAKHGVAPLLVVDYIQKLADEIALTQARPDLRIATSMASATLCSIAESTGAAIIAVSAIGRGKRALDNPRKVAPYQLVEVAKESGAVEYDGAGLIVLALSDDFDGDERIGTMTLAKARFGQECHIDARYDGRRGSWRDCGVVERIEKIDGAQKPGAAKSTKEATSKEEIRQRLIRELHASNARGKEHLLERCKGNKAQLRNAYDDLLNEGVIQRIPGAGITLSELGRQRLMNLAGAQ